MHLNTCKTCAGATERVGNYYVCKFCGNKWVIDADQDVHVIDRANAWSALRDCDFEKSVELFENILYKEPENHEAYWGRALADAGIIYVTDLDEHKKVPTCNNIREESFLNSCDVQKAISLAPADIANTYKKQAEQIEQIRLEWLKKASKEPEYDVFICFKDSDREHHLERTDDSYDAQELYNTLTAEGYKVFFSRVSLRGKVSEHYEPYIYNALKTAKVMIVFGEKAEYFNAVWVKNEWMRFRKRMERGEKHKNSMVVVYKNMNPADLPIGLRSRQCLNANELTFLENLKQHIEKIVHPQKTKAVAIGDANISEATPPKKKKAVLIAAVAFVLAISITLGFVFSNSFWKDNGSVDTTPVDPSVSESDSGTENSESTPNEPSLFVENKEHDVTVTFDDTMLPAGTTLSVQVIENGANYEKVQNALDELAEQFYAYDMNLNVYGSHLEPSGDVTVSLPLPNTISAKEAVVYYISAEGVATEMSSTVVDGYISFETDHFSIYVVAQRKIPRSTIMFHANGGVGTMENIEVYSSQITKLPVNLFSKLGYHLAGWSSTENGEIIALDQGDYQVGAAPVYNIYAVWEPNTYGISLNVNGGVCDQGEVTATYNQAYTLPTPTWEGHTFSGWFLGETKFESGTWYRTSNITLTAKWDLIYYDLFYVLNGGSAENVNTYHTESGATINNPTKTGYTFLGWTYEGQTTPKKDVVLAPGTIGDKTLTAHWQANEYTVTLHANGGSVSPSTVTVPYNEEYTLPTPEWEGHEFKGWYNGGEQVIDGVWNWTSNLTLTAQWDVQRYTIEYILNGGTNAASNPIKYNVNTETFVLADPTRAGYTFLGWTYEGQTTPVKSVTVSKGTIGNKTYTANWQAISSTVTFDPNGGDCDVSTLPVTYGEEMSLPTPEKEGHTFSGWYNGTTQVKSGTCTFVSDTILIAQWNITEYTVHYEMNGGTNDPINPNSYNYNDTITLAEPTRIGYAFVGWTFAGQDTPTKEVTIVVGTTGNKAYTANWSANTYTITFNANSGSVTPSTLDATFDTNVVLPTPTRTGYGFDGWFNGTTQYTTGTWKHDGDITLTAKWTANSYKASYNADGGTVSNSYKNYTFDASYTLLTPTRTGYEFLGWYNGDNLVPQSGVWTFDSDISLKAKWQAKTYTVTFDAGPGTSSMPSVQATYDSNFTLATAERVGYTFDGWYYNGTKYNSGAWKTDASITLTAKWTAREDIAYVVNHHQQNTNDDGYTIVSTEELKGTADASITPSVKSFTHFISPSAKTVTVKPDGTLVVDYYYDRVTYDLTYVTNGGETIEKQTYKYDQTLVISTPTRAGYTFGGWFTDATLDTAYSATATLNADTTIYAYWSEENKPTDFTYSGTDAITISGYSGTSTTMWIPAYIGGIPVRTIPVSAFENNADLLKVVVPEYVTSIGLGAFKGCSAIEDITLPFVGKSADATYYDAVFGYIFGYTYSETDGYATTYHSEFVNIVDSTTGPDNTIRQYNRVVDCYNYYSYNRYSFEQGICYYIPTSIRNVTITSQTQIPVAAFNNCYFIEIITIPNNVTSIGECAFQNCNSLKRLNSTQDGEFYISENVSEIKPYTFKSCDEMTEIVIPSGSISVASYAFNSCAQLAEFDCIITSVGDYSFTDCISLSNVQLSADVTSIGQYAFSGCIAISKINSDTEGEMILPESITTIGEYAFQNLELITKVVVSENVISIGSNAFNGCAAIETITVPFVGNNVDSTSRFNTIFGTVPGALANIVITADTTIPSYAFSGLSTVESITIPTTVMSIGDYAFQNCGVLKRLNSTTDGLFNIPTEVTEIKQYTFKSCDEMTKVVIPANVVNIDAYAFNSCAQLAEVEFTAGCILETIGKYAFADCISISELQLPTTLTSFGNYAFSGCISIVKINSNTDGEMILPGSVTTIGEYAFQNLELITKLVVQENVTVIGVGAFKGCNAIEDITLPFVGKSVDAIYYDAVFGYIFGYEIKAQTSEYLRSSSKEFVSDRDFDTITGAVSQYGCFTNRHVYYGNTPDEYTLNIYCYYIPNTIERVTITAQTTVPTAAFNNCNFIESITISDAVTSIGSAAFQNCSSLKRLNSTIDGVVNIPAKVSEIKMCAFKSCEELTNVTIPASVTNISDYAFYACTQLSKVDFKDGCKLEIVGNSAFSDCISIVEIQLPNAVSSIGNYAFSGCISIEKFNGITDGEMLLPKNIIEIGEYAFQNLELITKVVIPDSVTSIGVGAFKGCSAIEDITLPFVGKSADATYYDAVFGYIFGYEIKAQTSEYLRSSSKEFVSDRDFDTITGAVSQYGCFTNRHVYYGNTPDEYTLNIYCYYIPETIRCVTVTVQTTLPTAAFNNCDFIGTITISKSVSEIGDFAFKNCDATINQTYDSKLSYWNGSDVSTSLHGSGTESDPYQINSAADLAFLANSVNAGESYAGKYFVLNVDVNLNSKSWMPIGTKAKPFAGTFDGNGKKIYNLSVTMDVANAGLFGYVSGTVKNLGIVSGTVAPASTAASTYVGGLVGYLTGTVKNCYSQATVNVSTVNTTYAGGLIGYVDTARVENSYAAGNVTVTSTSGFAYAGGFVGMNKGTILCSLAFGNVTAHGQNDSYSRNGGFVANNPGILTHCYRSELQVLTQYTTVGSAYCDDGSVDSYSDMITYAQTNWEASVWNFDLKYPSHK